LEWVRTIFLYIDRTMLETLPYLPYQDMIYS